MTVTNQPFSTSLRTVSTLRLAFDPVRDTQAIFRTVLAACSWPGSIQLLPVAAEGAPLNGWAAGVLITLLDHEVTLAVEPFAGSDELETFVGQRSNPGSARIPEADFIVASTAALEPDLVTRAKGGTLTYPDDGATIVVLVDTLEQVEGATRRLALAGPGIPEETEVVVSEISDDFLAARARAIQNYPCGVDMLLIDNSGRLMAWPRSTRLTMLVEEGA